MRLPTWLVLMAGSCVVLALAAGVASAAEDARLPVPLGAVATTAFADPAVLEELWRRAVLTWFVRQG